MNPRRLRTALVLVALAIVISGSVLTARTYRPSAPAENTGQQADDAGVRAPEDLASSYFGVSVSAADRYVPGQLLVRVDPSLDEPTQSALAAALGAEIIKRPVPGSALVLLQFPPGVDVPSLATSVRGLDEVLAAEPNFIYRTSEVPDDPDFPLLWGLYNDQDTDIDAPEAWDEITGSTNVVIAVIDTGIDYNHVDLVDNVWTNVGEIPGNNIDDDNNGYIDDVHGIDTFNDDADPFDDEGHGTHVSGTIAARGNNGVGITGVMWQAKIAACKFLSSSGWGTSDGALACLAYISDLKNSGVNIVATNNSWGGGEYSDLLHAAIGQHQTDKMLFIVAAGNDGTNNDIVPHYPSSYDLDNIISVAAIFESGTLTGFSNYGAGSVDIAAPGSLIYSTIPGNAYAFASGTSMATPHVTGVAGLLAANNPQMSMQEIRQYILTNGAPSEGLAGLVASGSRLRADLPFVDLDGDSMSDHWEVRFGLDPTDPADAAYDMDNDGLTNLDEYMGKTDPLVADTDGDGLNDGDEVHTYHTDPLRADTDGDGLGDFAEVQQYQTDPLRPDSDGDGLGDAEEVNTHGTNPNVADTDGDGMPDGWEIDNEFNPLQGDDAASDADGDGLDNLAEYQLGTNPNNIDTDSDGLSDADEVNLYLTDPNNADSDGDQIADGWEIRYGFDPLSAADAILDPDNDQFANLAEYRAGTDPTDPASIPRIEPWVTTQGTAAHNGHAQLGTNVADFSERWSIQTGGQQAYADISASDSRLIVTERTDEWASAAYSLSDGSQLWHREFPGASNVGYPAISGDQVILARNDYGVGYRLSLMAAKAGEPVRHISVNDELQANEFVPYQGAVYYRDGLQVAAVDAESGVEIWRSDVPTTSSPNQIIFAADNQYLVAFGWPKLYVFDRTTGQYLFDFQNDVCPQQQAMALVLDDTENVYIHQYKCVTKFDLTTQSTVWQYENNQLWKVQPSLDDNAIYVSTPVSVIALDRDTGEEAWSRSFNYVDDSNLVTSVDHLFVSTVDGTVAIDLATQAEVWSHPARGHLAITEDGALLISDGDRSLISINIDGDTDGDGIPNWWERYYRLNHLDASDAAEDWDGDGLSNVDEFLNGTNPASRDTDGDGLEDGDEVDNYGTDPTAADTDGDGLQDGREINEFRTDPRNADSDGDDISDGDEVYLYGTDPADSDSVPVFLRAYQESFESGLPAGWTAAVDIDNSWAVSADDASDGQYSLNTVTSPDYQLTAIEWTQLFAAGELTFDLKFVSALVGPRVELLIDGKVAYTYWPQGWTRETVPLSQGRHTISWRLAKSSPAFGSNVYIDNVGYSVAMQLAARKNRLVGVAADTLFELDMDGNLTREPIPIPGATNPRDLVVTSDHKIVIADAPRLYFFDPVTGRFSNVVDPELVGDYNPVRSPLATYGNVILVANGNNNRGVLRYDLDGNRIDTVLPNSEFRDLSIGGDGFLYGLRKNGDIVDRISLSDYSILASVQMTSWTNAIDVDADGNIYALADGKISRYDSGGSLQNSLQEDALAVGTDLALTGTNQLVVATIDGIVGYTDTDLQSFRSAVLPFGDGVYGVNLSRVSLTGADQDGDGLPDWWEILYELNAKDPADAALDPDADGLDNLAEYAETTDPTVADTDGDGLSDSEESRTYLTDPLDTDTDSDGLSDFVEVTNTLSDPGRWDTDGDGLGDGFEVQVTGTDPSDFDTDGDGIDDRWEHENALNPLDANDALFDPDADGLTNLEEYETGADMLAADTDLDGLSDGQEVHDYATDPLLDDTDGDRLTDGWEVQFGFDPLADIEAGLDADGDGYANVNEFFAESDPLSADSRPRPRPWVTLQGNSHHTGFVPTIIDPDALRFVWTVDIVPDDATPLRLAAAADGLAWVGTNGYFSTQVLAAVVPRSGEVLWIRDFGSINELSPPAYMDGQVYVQTGGHADAFIWGFDGRTGEPGIKTAFPAQWLTVPAPTPYDGDIFATAGLYGGISSFSGTQSVINWNGDIVQYDQWTPAVDESYVYAYSRDRLKVFERLTGGEVFDVPNPGDLRDPFGSSPVRDRYGNIVIVQAGRAVYFDLQKRVVRWRSESNLLQGQLTLAGRVVFAVAAYGSVVALDARDGSEIWRWTAPEQITSQILATVDHLIVSSQRNTYVVDMATHQAVWTYAAGGQLSLSPEGYLLIAGTSGDLTAIATFGDADNDGMPDRWEEQYGLDSADPADAETDMDSDGLKNVDEYIHGTDPTMADVDGDGLTDGDEVNLYGSNPLETDTDRDGLTDGDEVNLYGTDPTAGDTDFDGLTDADEIAVYGTDPADPDTDGDTHDDGTEVRLGSDPIDASDKPAPIYYFEESFESGILPPGWSKPGDADYTWHIERGTTTAGLYRLASDAITHNQSASVEYTAYTGNGTMSFSSKVSAEACCDLLRVFVDGIQKLEICDGIWSTYELQLSKGIHTIRWTYSKNGSIDRNDDAAYIDMISMVSIDSDSDGLPDDWEIQYNLDPNNAADASSDPDTDGLSNADEFAAGTSPRDADSDGDGMPDGWEVRYALDPLSDDSALDPDNDNADNISEYQAGTDPHRAPAPPPPAPSPKKTGGGGGGSVNPFMLLAMFLLLGLVRARGSAPATSRSFRHH